MRTLLYIVPRRGVNTLCTVADGKLVDVFPVPVPNLADRDTALMDMP